jgi:small-conductance mechanosensitive channel
MLIWSLLILVALENLGVNITALLAGLGVGGVAVALALQNVLGDLFASLSIALDKPFVVGDTLTIDTFTGASNASASRPRACAAIPASRSSCRTPTS